LAREPDATLVRRVTEDDIRWAPVERRIETRVDGCGSVHDLDRLAEPLREGSRIDSA
jgi:hypothetical protein